MQVVREITQNGTVSEKLDLPQSCRAYKSQLLMGRSFSQSISFEPARIPMDREEPCRIAVRCDEDRAGIPPPFCATLAMTRGYKTTTMCLCLLQTNEYQFEGRTTQERVVRCEQTTVAGIESSRCRALNGVEER